MELIQNTPEISAYLVADEVIDHEHPCVRATAATLSVDAPDAYAYAKAAFEFVRDTIPHSQDVGDERSEMGVPPAEGWGRVTWRASDVLAQRTGICYAKAHALAALLRAEGIPTALCYQKFEVVHGLVAVQLPGEDRWSGRIRGATSPASTHSSASTASSSPSLCGLSAMNWTIQCYLLNRTRPCSNASVRPSTGLTSGRRSPPISEERP
ncbi:Transglutaminase-like enzymes, putative cysteine proteases [Streptomyces sp. SceaMP-e96]|nr:Transglutaminase-like enzymes, putative cysteine proteases [Streptomyces sp. SceaMP-e96]